MGGNILHDHFKKDELGTSPINTIRTDMDDAKSKAELTRRTKRAMGRIARHNTEELVDNVGTRLYSCTIHKRRRLCGGIVSEAT